MVICYVDHFQREGVTISASPYTWDDFLELDEDDLRELIDGQLVEVEKPTQTHEHIVGMLCFFLTGWAREHRTGRALPSGYKVRIAERRGYMPDVQFYRHGGVLREQDKGLATGHPDLVVEVISPTSKSRDRIRKMQDYAAIGVPEYWLVDPEARTLERLLLRDGTYLIAEGLDEDQVFRPDSFAGLEIPLAELWAAPEDAGT